MPPELLIAPGSQTRRRRDRNACGQCWRTAPRRVIIDNGYGYYPRRYYDDRYDYDDAPAVGVYGPGFSFGFGPRPYW